MFHFRFILRKKPHVVVIGGESREALSIKEDVSGCIQQLIEDEQFPRIPIEITDNTISKIYSNSIRGRVSSFYWFLVSFSEYGCPFHPLLHYFILFSRMTLENTRIYYVNQSAKPVYCKIL